MPTVETTAGGVNLRRPDIFELSQGSRPAATAGRSCDVTLTADHAHAACKGRAVLARRDWHRARRQWSEAMALDPRWIGLSAEVARPAQGLDETVDLARGLRAFGDDQPGIGGVSGDARARQELDTGAEGVDRLAVAIDVAHRFECTRVVCGAVAPVRQHQRIEQEPRLVGERRVGVQGLAI